MKNITSKFNTFFLIQESKFGTLLVSLLFGLLITGLLMIYIEPRFEAAYHGLQYSLLSNDPFNFTISNPLRYRILPSLLGYLFFLRGDLFFILPLIFTVLFISSIYWVYRKKLFDPTQALLMTGVIAFSCTVFIQLVAPGYTDNVLYFFLFLSFSFIKKPYISGFFYLLALLTHECSLFLLPGLLLWYSYSNKGNIRDAINYFLILVFSIIILLFYRYWISSHIAVEYDMSFYFSKKNILFSVEKAIAHLPLGIFYAFRLFWIFPLIAVWNCIMKKKYLLLLTIFAIFFGALAQLIIAFDITRMICLAFPLLLISLEQLKEEWNDKQFTRFVLIIFLLNFIIPTYFMSADGLVAMNSIFRGNQ